MFVQSLGVFWHRVWDAVHWEIPWPWQEDGLCATTDVYMIESDDEDFDGFKARSCNKTKTKTNTPTTSWLLCFYAEPQAQLAAAMKPDPAEILCTPPPKRLATNSPLALPSPAEVPVLKILQVPVVYVSLGPCST